MKGPLRVALFGATGMVGSGVLLECLDDPRVRSVLVVARKATGVVHEKVREILHDDFLDLAPIQHELAGCDACFFCLGVSVAGLGEDDYRRLTHDLTLAAARSMLSANPRLTFCYVSGAGTDSSARGRVMWARVKGETENDLLAMPFAAAFMFRPAFIQPQRGVRSKTPLYRGIYVVLAPLYPLLRRVFPAFVTTSVEVGRAMIEAAANGYPKRIVATEDIRLLAERGRGGR